MNLNEEQSEYLKFYEGLQTYSNITRKLATVSTTLFAASIANVFLQPTPALQESMLIPMGIAAVGTLFGAGLYFCNSISKNQLAELQNKIKDNPDFPLANIDEVSIECDISNLMNRTARLEQLEWGMMVKSRLQGNTGVITDIQELGDIGSDISPTHISIDSDRIREAGFNGTHHYHPLISAQSYFVHEGDRLGLYNGVKLLSFNTVRRTELIAFNFLDTFLPTNPEKTHFVKATHEDIMEYLA